MNRATPRRGKQKISLRPDLCPGYWFFDVNVCEPCEKDRDYAGHQFGHFVPQLGDGRAILLGEIQGQDGSRRDIQLKGSGRTPFSRDGDGRAALGPVLREYIVSEAMAALGVPTTRALAAVTTGQPVLRETALPGAVLTRVAASHIRVGTFSSISLRGAIERPCGGWRTM